MKQLALSVGLALVFALPAFAQSNDASGGGATSGGMDELRGEVAQLRRELADLKGQLREQDENWLDRRRSEEVRQVVRDVLDDADTRSSFLDDTATAGIDDRGAFFRSPGDAYELRIGGLLQFRYLASSRDDAPAAPGGGDDFESGFTVHRARLKFFGHVADPRLRYFLQLDANRASGNIAVLDAYTEYDLTPGSSPGSSPDLTVRAGRFVGPFLREQLTGAGAQLSADRSYVNGQFSLGRVEGVMLTYQQSRFRLAGALSDGGGSGNPGGVDNDFDDDASDFALTGRADLRLLGDWSRYGDFQAWSDDDSPAAFLGTAIHYERGETGENTVNHDTLAYTLDGSYEVGRATLYAAAVGRHEDYDDGTGSVDTFGYLAQAGVMVVPDTLQPFARYAYLDFDDAPDLGLVTLGANYFLHRNSAKITVDLVWAMDPVAAGAAGLGLLPDSGEDQLVLRGQFQLGF